jgi:hypothetical protein
MGLLLTGVGGKSQPAPQSPPFFLAAKALSVGAQVLEEATVASAPAGSRLYVYFDTHSAIEPIGIANGPSAGLSWQSAASINQGGRKKLFWADLAAELEAGELLTATAGQSGRHALLAFCAPGGAGWVLDVRHATGLAGTFTAPSTNQPSITSPALTEAKAKFVIGMVELAGAAAASEITEPAGWTGIGSTPTSTHWLLHLAYQVVPAGDAAPRTYNPTLSTNRNWVTDILVFREP